MFKEELCYITNKFKLKSLLDVVFDVKFYVNHYWTCLGFKELQNAFFCKF